MDFLRFEINAEMEEPMKDIIGEIKFPKVSLIKVESKCSKNGVNYFRITAKAKSKAVMMMVWDDDRKINPYKRMRDCMNLANEWENLSLLKKTQEKENEASKYADAVFLKETLLTVTADWNFYIEDSNNAAESNYFTIKDWGYGINDVYVRKMLLKAESDTPELKVSLSGFGT